MVISYLEKIFQAISSFTSYYGGLIEACTSYEDTVHLEQHEGDSNVQPGELAREWNRLQLEEISFSYQAGERQGLSNVSFPIVRGEKIVLIGPSGGGKSTLLKLLGGMHLPQQGVVVVDDGERLPCSAVGSRSLLIPQEPQIFSETLLYNLTMSEPIPPEELEEMITTCRLEELLFKLPDGWLTNLAQNGLNLSGGERQRIALARGLLRAKGRDIILLDEPTSALDPNTEHELFIKILERFEHTTILMSCHRWSLLPLFDRVILLEGGRVRRDEPSNRFFKEARQNPSCREDFEIRLAARRRF